MTVASVQYRAFAANMRAITGLSPVEVGVVPDEAHMDPPAGYHVSAAGIRKAGRWDRDYSTRQSRDRTAPTSDYASGFDIGDNWPNGGRTAWLRWNNLFLGGLVTRDPELAAVRAVNISRDGVERKRYDTLHPEAGLIPSTDTVTIHTHGETWRDTLGTAALDRAFRRLETMARAAITGTPLVPTGGFLMALSDQQQEDLWQWLALLVDPGTPATGRPGDRFHFPPLGMQAFKLVPVLQTQVTALAATVNALAAAIEAGGGNVDVAAIFAKIDEATAKTKAEVDEATAAAVAAGQEARDAVGDLGEGGTAQVRADA
ncbi:MAG: hypothetical protein ABW046_22470 [Actinoplanes sp.]